MDTEAQLRGQWQQMLRSGLFDPDKSERILETVLRAYGKPHRHYHNAEHLTAMFRLFDQFRPRLQNPDLTAAAIFFHDVVYNPARRDNEAKSAALAARQLPALGFTPEETEAVCRMILATQKHELPENAHPDLAWLLDFDLAILGSDRDTYQEYTQKIRREYRIYPDLVYKPGRRKAMEHFLQRPAIFHTPAFHALFETKARQNIEKEIGFLR